MTFSTSQLTRIAFALVAATLLLVPVRAAAKPEARTVTVTGSPTSVDEQSVKCEVGLPAWVSSRRLANCDSAVVIRGAGSKESIVRFVIAPGDPLISEGTRAELRDLYTARNGEEVWYRFSTLIPGDFPLGPTTRVVTAQWHEQMPLGAPHKRPPLAHRILRGDFVVTLWNDDVYGASRGEGDGVVLLPGRPVVTEVLHEYAYRIVWSPDEAGRVTGWRRETDCSPLPYACRRGRWSQFVDRAGAIGFAEADGYYFKLGVYTTHSFARRMVVYHRGYRRASTVTGIGLTREELVGAAAAAAAAP